MDGIAHLDQMRLADKYDALVMVDECHVQDLVEYRKGTGGQALWESGYHSGT